jgi:hypothetical protein
MLEISANFLKIKHCYVYSYKGFNVPCYDFKAGCLLEFEHNIHILHSLTCSTYGGNPLGCAVGVAVLTELIDGGLINKIEEKSIYLKEKLLKLKEQ